MGKPETPIENKPRIDGRKRGTYRGGMRIGTYIRTAGRIGLAAGLLAAAGCASVPVSKDPWFGRDKAEHFAGSAVLAGVATLVAANQGLSDGEAAGPALGVTLVVGLGKEAYDANVKKTFWSWRDLTWGVAGGLTGYGLALLAP